MIKTTVSLELLNGSKMIFNQGKYFSTKFQSMLRIFSLLSGSFRSADGLGMPDVFDFAFACLLLIPVDLPGPVSMVARPLDRVLGAV